MGEIERSLPVGTIEQWVAYLRRQRSRARDAIWLLDQGFTVHDGRDGTPTADASGRVRKEHETAIAEINGLLDLYDHANLPTTEPLDNY